MRRPLPSIAALAFALLFACAGGITAQNPRERPGTALIMGVVIDNATGAPVQNVRVTRWPTSRGNLQTEVISDASGRFLFTHVPAGSYRLVAERTGYLIGAYGRRRVDGPSAALEVADGARLTDIELRIFGVGYLTGTVRDEWGSPVADVSLFALRAIAEASGPYTFEFPRTGKTDDRGRFSLSVAAGDYAIVVPPSGLTTIPPADTRPVGRPPILADGLHLLMADAARGTPVPYVARDGTGTGYALSAYPESAFGDEPRLARARSREIVAGLDITLRAVPLTTITGVVIGPEGPVADAEIRMMPPLASRFATGTGAGFDGGMTRTGRDGRFTLAGVPADEYDLSVLKVPQATPPPGPAASTIDTPTGEIAMSTMPAGPAVVPHGPTLWAKVPMRLGGDRLEGLTIIARRGARASGRLIFDGDPQPAEAAVERIGVWLQAWGSSPGSVPIHRASADGTFQTAEYRPGLYTVSATQPVGWIIASVRQQGRDLHRDPFELGDTDLTDVAVTLTNRLGTLAGTVRTSSGAPARDASVIALPAPTSYRQGRVWPTRQQTRVSADGSFVMPGLLPGDYLLATIDDAAVDEVMNAKLHAWLVAVSRRVTVSVAGTPPVTLTTVVRDREREHEGR